MLTEHSGTSSKTLLCWSNAPRNLEAISRVVSDCIGKDININQNIKEQITISPLRPFLSTKKPRAHGRNIYVKKKKAILILLDNSYSKIIFYKYLHYLRIFSSS